jgi:biotin transport system substrate-specific component
LLTGGVYVAMVLVGLPVLADGERAMGLAFLQLKSAGYVVGFAPGAWATGWLGARGGWRHWVGAGILGHAVILACGVPLLAMWLGLPTALSYGLYPFLPGVLVKSVLAAGVVAASRRVRSA